MPGSRETVRVGDQGLRPCGTPAAYRRHLRRGEPVDEKCRAWHAQDVLVRTHQIENRNPMKARTCEECGGLYDATGGRQRFCPDCSPWMHRDDGTPLKARTCEDCGELYDATASRQRFCPDCSPWLKEVA